MKKIVLALALLVAGSEVRAQSSTDLVLPVVGSVDFATLVANSGPIFAYDNHGRKWAGASMRVLWTPADPAMSLADLEVGVLWDATSGVPSGVTTSIGLRADNIANRLGATSWAKRNFGFAPVPAVEIGPWGGYLPVEKQWVYGGFISKKFGK